MSGTAVTDVIFWVMMLRTVVPPVMSLLGLSRMRARVTEDPAGAQPRDDDPDYERWFRQLSALGLAPLGTSVASAWFSNSGTWYRRFPRSRWLATPDGRTLPSFFARSRAARSRASP